MKKSRPYIWYMLPGLIFYSAFMILPIFLTALISLTGFNAKKLAKNSEILLDKGGLLGYNKEADFGGAEII